MTYNPLITTESIDIEFERIYAHLSDELKHDKMSTIDFSDRVKFLKEYRDVAKKSLTGMKGLMNHL